MGRPVVFVIGASGRVGIATLRRLSENHADGFELLAGVRNPEAGEKKLADLQNVTVVKAEMGSGGLEETFKGVDALFIVTPPTDNCGELVGKTAAAAKSAKVNFVLALSGATADIVDVIFGAQNKEVEERVRQVGIEFCFLRLHAFFENTLCWAKSIKENALFDEPVDGEKAHAMLAVSDIAKAAAAILTGWSKHSGQTYTLASQVMSYADVAKQLSAALGKDVQYVRKPYDERRSAWLSSGWPESACDGLLQFYKLVDAGSPAVTACDLSVLESICGEKPIEFKDFLAANIKAFQ